MSGSDATSRLGEALARADAEAPFLRRLIVREQPVVDRLAAGDLAGAIASAREPDADDVATRLRRTRRRLALAIAIGDLAGLLTLEEVVRLLSDFADDALDRAIRAAIEERTPGAEPTGFAALALGKHGSRELNYSSDIDPILLFDPATLATRRGEDPAEAAARIAKRVVALLQTPDGEGHVFRVDLRLRPSPEATPPAVPVGAAIAYYESSALPWERAAFIRARAVGGDVPLGARFLDAIRPFVWRRALDFGAIGELRAISRRIRDHHHRGQVFAPGYDLKRGRGGIREAEFFAQIHQLVHGGRDPGLRAPATLDALAALAAAGWIAPADAAELAEAYRLYRTIEHRLQMVEDQQTHRLPRDAAALDGVARLHGVAGGDALLGLLRPHVEAVGRLYDGLDPPGGEGLAFAPDALEVDLAAAGFVPAGPAAQRIARWREGGARALRSASAQAALEAVLPVLIRALGRAPDPMAALNRFDDVVAKLPSAINLFRLLEARPSLAALLGDVLSLAPTLAEALGRRPTLIDGLIDASALDPAAGVATLAARFAARRGEDYQAVLDRVRGEVGELRFAQGVQIVSGSRDPLNVAGGYSRIAEGALDALSRAAIAGFETVHGRVPGGELVILALGRFGGAALTHASDLDLIFLFTGDFAAESDGGKPLGATQYFNRLAQRVIAAMSVPTAAGPLYEIDTRLRPSGAQGLLAVSVDSFARYERQSAWTWEHMALTRARAVFGNDAARAQVAAIVAETLERPRDAATLVHDAVAMRAEMAKHKPPAGPLDVKLSEGGLVDLEFLVHVTQLRARKGFAPELGRAVAMLVEEGLLPVALIEAHDLLTRLLVAMRLMAPGATEPAAPVREALARACEQPDWDALLAALERARQTVRTCWRRIGEG